MPRISPVSLTPIRGYFWNPWRLSAGERIASRMPVRFQYLGLAFLLAYSLGGAASNSNQANEIVQRSVARTNADWDAAPEYGFTVHDVITRKGSKTSKTYEVLMIEGSPYNRPIAINGRKLTPAEIKKEDRKLQQEIKRRRDESPAARQKRVAEYEKERRQDHALLREMVKGFDYTLAGEDTVNGRRCFLLEATPKPGYQPPTRDTQVLWGMRGKMWVDMQQYQWVRVTAEVFRPVSFGLFFATVKPGTEFTLEQMPVKGELWLPSHFSMEINARVLLWRHLLSDNETYTRFRFPT